METLFTNRKGQQGINVIGSIALAILIGAVILGLGATILEKIKDTQTDKSITIPNNESFGWQGNNTEFVLVQNTITPSSGVAYCNATKLLLDGNFSMSTGGIKILNTSKAPGGNATFDSCSYNVTYSYLIGSSALNTSGFGLTGVNTFASFIPTVAIVAIAGVVIGIILFFFGRTRRIG